MFDEKLRGLDGMTLDEIKRVFPNGVSANAMHENNLTVYRFDDYIVSLKSGKENVKVKSADEPEDENPAEE